jgi:P4 family phage/plasmid primase-like protien
VTHTPSTEDEYAQYFARLEADKARAKLTSGEYIAELAEREKAKVAPASNLINLAVAKEARQPKPLPAPSNAIADHIRLGGAVVDVIRDRGHDIMFTEKAAYFYRDGLWSMKTDGLAYILNSEIQKGAKHMGMTSSNRLTSEARCWIQREKKLQREHDDIAWDAHGLVPTKSGLVDPRTLKVRPMRPDDYCTWRIETEYDEHAKCPWWLKMLEDCFEDRSKEERAATIAVIQELLGAGLIDDKPRELSRALIFQGGSNFGKSGLLEVLSGLFGRDVNATSIEELEGAHGMMKFVKRSPWVLHEAFDQRKWHFSSSVKAIITGEPISVNIKNGPLLSIRVKAPIFWGTNHPPQFKEATKAVTNRLTVIECKREFLEDKPVGAAVEAFRRGLGKPSNLVLETEMPGLLAWALEGLRRALQRGRLLPTASMSATIDEIRRDSNMVAGFLKDCCEHDPDRMVSTPDFGLAFSAWWQAEKGETYSPPSNDAIGKAVAAMSDPRIALGRGLRDMHRRYYPGLTLNEQGVRYHEAGLNNRNLVAKTANTTAPSEDVNEPIPITWDAKPEVIAMRALTRVEPTDTDGNHTFGEIWMSKNRNDQLFQF